jgi:hypothetical protein
MGKVKVVPVEQETPVEIPSDVAEPSEPEVKSEPVDETLAVEAPVVEESKPSAKKEPSMISCEKCGKSMLMKTFKYSHLKVCKSATPEPPPPPHPFTSNAVVTAITLRDMNFI